MAWIIAKKSDLSVVEISNKNPDFTKNELKTVIPVNYGGVANDYSYYNMLNNETKRVMNGDDYTLTWTANDITAISFADEDIKKWIRFSSDVKKARADGSDAINITAKIWLYDNSAIDTSYNGSMLIDIGIGRDIGIMKLIFTNGVAAKALTTTQSGYWTVPADVKQVIDDGSLAIRTDKAYKLNLKLITL